MLKAIFGDSSDQPLPKPRPERPVDARGKEIVLTPAIFDDLFEKKGDEKVKKNG